MRQLSLFPYWVKFYKTFLVADSLLGDLYGCRRGEGGCNCARAIKRKHEKEHVHETPFQLSVLRILQHCLWNYTHGLNVKILHVVAE